MGIIKMKNNVNAAEEAVQPAAAQPRGKRRAPRSANLPARFTKCRISAAKIPKFIR